MCKQNKVYASPGLSKSKTCSYELKVRQEKERITKNKSP